MENKKQFWIIRVNDGENFRNDEPLIKINNLYNHYENFKFYAEPKIFN